YRNSGTIDFVAACASVFLIAEDPEEPDRRVLAHVRNKLGKKQPSLSFYIDNNGFRWGESVNMTANDLLAPGESKTRERRQLDAAKAFLEKVLENGPVKSDDIMNTAVNIHGIARRTLWRAKDEMGIRAQKERFGPWWWRLPPGAEEPEENGAAG